MTVGQFFDDQIRDCRVHVWPIGRQHDKPVDRQSVISKSFKYRNIQDTNEIQESTGQLQKYRNLQDLQDRWDHCDTYKPAVAFTSH